VKRNKIKCPCVLPANLHEEGGKKEKRGRKREDERFPVSTSVTLRGKDPTFAYI